MTNVDQVRLWKKEIEIPKGWYQIKDEVKDGDQVCMISINSQRDKLFTVTWLKVDASEIGKHAGQIVIRRKLHNF